MIPALRQGYQEEVEPNERRPGGEGDAGDAQTARYGNAARPAERRRLRKRARIILPGG